MRSARRTRALRTTHARSEKAKLLVLVDRVSSNLGRPVSSADVEAYLRRHPAQRPHFIKRMGQQLIAATRPLKGYVPVLVCVGSFRSKNYYCLEASAEASARFNDFCIEEQVRELQSLDLPGAIAVLRVNPAYQRLADHAWSGWTTEVGFLLGRHRETRRLSSALGYLPPDGSDLERNAFRYTPPRFLDRKAATQWLRSEVQVRTIGETPVSPLRHLSRWRWPQAAMLPRGEGFVVAAEQWDAFIRSKWPAENEDPEIDAALAQALRYGLPLGEGGKESRQLAALKSPGGGLSPKNSRPVSPRR